MIPFPPFEPDRSRFAFGSSPLAINCMPVADGWGPIPQFVPVSTALPGAPRGACYVRTSTGAFKIFAGTETGLYQFDTATQGWTDVSGTTYSVPVNDKWQFEQFGDTLVATQLGDPVQYINIESGTQFDDLPGSPPRAKYVGTAGDFVILAHLAGDPLGIRTSGIGAADFWTTGLRLSGDQTLPDGEDIQGLLGGENGCYIFQRKKIRQLSITSNVDFPFVINVVNASRGVVSPLSIAGIGPDVIGYLSADGFCLGVEGRPIGGERVDRWFNGQLDQTALLDVVGTADPYQKIIWWQATRPDQTRFMVGYQWQLDRWCYSDQNLANLVDLVTPSVSWDAADDYFANWDDADVPWDARFLTGGLPTFAAFDNQNRLGFFSGLPMQATVDTGLVQLASGRRAYLKSARAVTDAATFTMRAGAVATHGGTMTLGSPVTPYSTTGVCHFRLPGLLHQFRQTIPAGEPWNHIIGLEPEFEGEGTR